MVPAMGVTVDGIQIRLRDVTLDDADLLDSWMTPEATGTFNDFGMSRSPVDREALAQNGRMRNERNGQLIVERIIDGRPLGTVSWHLEREHERIARTRRSQQLQYRVAGFALGAAEGAAGLVRRAVATRP